MKRGIKYKEKSIQVTVSSKSYVLWLPIYGGHENELQENMKSIW